MIGEVAALGAALCWTFGPLLAMGPVRQIGTATFSRLRFVFAFLFLALLALATGGWQAMSGPAMLALVTSGVVGFALGDYWMFAGMRILGPRRAGVIFALNAPMTALFGIAILGETANWPFWMGSSLAISGVVLAIAFRQQKNANNGPSLEDIEGKAWVGVLLVLGAAVCQAGGTIIARPVMAEGASPLAAGALRVGVAALIFAAPSLLRLRWDHFRCPPRAMAVTAVHAAIGPGLGAALMMLAVQHTSAGMAAILSALSPILILPILALGFRQRVHPMAWLGAVVTVGGTAIVLMP